MYLSPESTVATVLENSSSATLYVQEQFKCKCVHSVHVHCLLVYMYTCTSTQILVHHVHAITCNNHCWCSRRLLQGNHTKEHSSPRKCVYMYMYDMLRTVLKPSARFKTGRTVSRCIVHCCKLCAIPVCIEWSR